MIEKLNQAWPPQLWRDTTVVVAISGGADSVALLRALDSIVRQVPGRGKLIAAHLNHCLRGTESDQDEEFVVDLCHRLQLPLRTERATSSSDKARFSSADVELDIGTSKSESHARELRYAFLRQIVAECGARYLVTAHHADDQVETVLHRIIRGTGISGLAGIPSSREFIPGVSLVRPLLGIWRAELLEFLAGLQQPYRTDSSNASARFTRNRLRHELLPLIERDFNPRVKEALLRLATIAQDVTAVINQQVAQLLATTVRQRSAHAVSIDCQSLADVEPYLVRELLVNLWQQQNWSLREMSQDKWNEIVEMAMPPGAEKKMMLPGKILVHRAGNGLTVRLMS